MRPGVELPSFACISMTVAVKSVLWLAFIAISIICILDAAIQAAITNFPKDCVKTVEAGIVRQAAHLYIAQSTIIITSPAMYVR